jgi:molybdopterin synthase sulfur carrier subunit
MWKYYNKLSRAISNKGKRGVRMGDEEKAVVTLRLPSTLSAYSGGKSQITLHANTIEEMLLALKQQHPQVWQCLCTEQGSVREQVKMFVSNEMISGLCGLHTTLRSGQEVIVLPVTPGV